MLKTTFGSYLRRNEAGQALMELALFFPIALLLMLGVVDLGRAFHMYTTLANAAREGARYATSNPLDSAGVRAAIEQEASGSNIDLTTSSIIIEFPNGTTAPGNPVKVTITRPMSLVSSMILGDRTLSLSASSSMMIN